ncbi:MAG: N-acetylmuramate alpha-1-phosphate uridylyltransferase MurU [Pseudomonadota bacterium]
MRAMVLAAGRGMRMRPLTDRTPKPLLSVGGEPLIVHHLRSLHAIGVRDVLINVSWLGEQIREALGDGKRFGMRLVYSPEPEGALETGGGIYRALCWLGQGPFLVVNGDVWVDGLASWWQALSTREGDEGGLMLVPTPGWKARHDFTLVDGSRVRRGGATVTYAGVACLRAELFERMDACGFAHQARFPLAPLLFEAARDDRLSGAMHRKAWSDVGTPERLAEVDAQLSSA